MSLPPRVSKKRQYAPDETQVYYGSDSTGESQFSPPADSHACSEQRPLTDNVLEPQHVDLMTYAPDPLGLASPPRDVLLPPGFVPTVDAQSALLYQSPTLTVIPKTESLLRDVKVPLGLVISPHRTPAAGEEEIPLVQDGIIARCRQCRAYINPYVRLLDYGTRWCCSLCGATNNVPREFGWSRVVENPREQYQSRAELSHAVVDFTATTDYMRQPPQAPAYVFLLDVSESAINSGMFATAVRTILENLDRLPDEQQRTRVAIMCYDTVLYYFAFPPGSATFEMLVVSELEETYIPRCDDLLLNLSSAREALDALLERLPAMFGAARAVESATGAALDSARALLAPAGGKIVLLAASAPTHGRGALDAAASPSPRGSENEREADKAAAATFYHELAIVCIKGCVSVDVFLAAPGGRYAGVSTLSLLTHYTGGLIFYYPVFNAANATDVVKFAVELGRALAMPSMLEAEMRVRCSSGISVKSMHGNFFLQGPDRAVVPSVPLDQAYAVELQIDTTLEEPLAVVQTALLYTMSSGERRIRVMTLALPTVSTAGAVFAAADARALAVLLAKQATQRAVVLSLADRRDKLFQVVADVCAAYAAVHKTHTAGVRLMLPAGLRMLPVLVLALFKKLATQVNSERAFDMRAYTRALLTSAAPAELIRYIYPVVYGLHNMPPEAGTDEDGTFVLPPALSLTSAWWVQYGLYLMDDGQDVFLWIGRAAIPELVRDVFGAEDYEALRSGKIELPVLETGVSQSARALVDAIRGRISGVHYPNVYVVKDDATSDPALRTAVVQALVHDRIDELRLSYKQFLVKIHEKLN
ncbi:CPII coat sec24 protein [Mycena pura]|uniref:CPII coat sec24 protein n=1 Tax=Mycena pura TaxID=153505 RepID=A0AAD6V5J5_9AGAR|nr:CPII coat sec24 protein [Mycena pura]